MSLALASAAGAQAARDYLRSSAVAQAPDLDSHFDYDRTAPLDVVEVGVERRPNGVVHDLSYASPKGGRVPAYLVVPHTKARTRPSFGVIGTGTTPRCATGKFLEEALALAPTGVVSLLTDGPIARPGHVKDDSPERATGDRPGPASRGYAAWR